MNPSTQDKSETSIWKTIYEKAISLEKTKSHLILDSVKKGTPLVLDFSFVQSIEASNGNGIYIKIPKTSITKTDPTQTDNSDRVLATNEYKSLVHLQSNWKTTQTAQYITPLGFFPEHNAIITARFKGLDFYQEVVKSDISYKISLGTIKFKYADLFEQIGIALKDFHENEIEEDIFDKQKFTEKLRNISNVISKNQANTNFLSSLLKKLENAQYPSRTSFTYTIKGLDLRNILISEDRKLGFLDPGKLKREPVNADTARFITTCLILYWGKLPFFIKWLPNKTILDRFNKGYFKQSTVDRLTQFHIIKELLKHWKMAYHATDLKKWPKPLKSVIKKFYIDRFYKKILTESSKNL